MISLHDSINIQDVLSILSGQIDPIVLDPFTDVIIIFKEDNSGIRIAKLLLDGRSYVLVKLNILPGDHTLLVSILSIIFDAF